MANKTKKDKRISLDNIEKRIKKLMEKEDIKDTDFRFVITATELGDLGKYITHDPLINPNARPHGVKEDEILAYGQALVQLVALAQLRGIPLNKAFEQGLKNWEDADWRKAEAQKEDEITGISACPGFTQGKAYVALAEKDLKKIPPGSILVTKYAKPEISDYILDALNRDYPVIVNGFVTDHGGKTCHLANIARDYSITCIVGTGNATDLIKTGDEIIIDATEERGKVYKVKE